MTSALALYRRYDKAALIAQMSGVESDPANLQPGPSIHLLTPAARKRSAAIAQAVAWHMEDERKTAGRPVPTCGYSGRQTNRR